MPLNDDPDAMTDDEYWARVAELNGGPCHADLPVGDDDE